MKTGYTHIAMLLDRSGSMSSIRDFIIEGFNNFIREQKKVPGELTITLVQFDDNAGRLDYDTLLDFQPASITPELGDAYEPRGMTPLNDAWVKLINETGIKLAEMKEEERPEKVLLVSLTDGLENASKEYSPQTGGTEFIKGLVEHQESKYGWQFLYIGANQDSKEEANVRGTKNYMNFKPNKMSTSNAFNSMSAETTQYRSASGASFNLQEDEV